MWFQPSHTGEAQANRVENEVAMMTLAAAALEPNFEPNVVPRLYGWVCDLCKYFFLLLEFHVI
jgi:hypothetical protein